MVFTEMENIHGAIGMSGTPLFIGGWAMHAAIHMSLHGTCHGTQQGVPTCLNTRGKESRQKARKLYNIA